VYSVVSPLSLIAIFAPCADSEVSSTEEIKKRRKPQGHPMELIHQAETYAILGACFEVYREKGSGFGELVYQECLKLEFGLQSIPCRVQPELKLTYKGQPLEKTFVPDFICFDLVIVEIKALTALNDEHRAQVHNYLKATGLRVGLLVNFGHYPKIEHERIVR
jgi:GxxExxY protein